MDGYGEFSAKFRTWEKSREKITHRKGRGDLIEYAGALEPAHIAAGDPNELERMLGLMPGIPPRRVLGFDVYLDRELERDEIEFRDGANRPLRRFRLVNLP